MALITRIKAVNPDDRTDCGTRKRGILVASIRGDEADPDANREMNPPRHECANDGAERLSWRIHLCPEPAEGLPYPRAPRYPRLKKSELRDRQRIRDSIQYRRKPAST